MRHVAVCTNPCVEAIAERTYWPNSAKNCSVFSEWNCLSRVTVPAMNGAPSSGSAGFLHTNSPTDNHPHTSSQSYKSWISNQSPSNQLYIYIYPERCWKCWNLNSCNCLAWYRNQITFKHCFNNFANVTKIHQLVYKNESLKKLIVESLNFWHWHC